jgi:hypothetical protein
MANEIAAALIGGGAVIVAAALPSIFSNLRFVSLPASRRKQLEGSWRGTTQQAAGPDGTPITVDVVADVTVSWRKVSTKTRLKGGGMELQSRARGGFVWGDYLILNYKNVRPSLVNFGTVLLRFHSDGRHLSGGMVGYGANSERIVHGKMSLEKVDG